MTIGTEFMYEHGVILDFGRMTITVDGVEIPALAAGEEPSAKKVRHRQPKPTAAGQSN